MIISMSQEKGDICSFNMANASTWTLASQSASWEFIHGLIIQVSQLLSLLFVLAYIAAFGSSIAWPRNMAPNFGRILHVYMSC